MRLLLLLTDFHHDLQIHVLSPERLWICWVQGDRSFTSNETVNSVRSSLSKILRWASSWQNILYRYLQSKETEEVSETPWKWWPFTNQDPDCAIASPPPTKKEEPKEEMNPSLTILKFIPVLHKRQRFLGIFSQVCVILQYFWFYIC